MAGMYGCFKNRNSDSPAMASGAPDVTANQESAEVVEECSGKKKSKFQAFKKFFARKKRKEPPAAGADAGLKASQSSDNVSKASENNTLTRSEKDKGSGSKVSLGSKALSHDSVFVSDLSEANEALGASQDSIHGKVKSLQLQLKQAIRLGSPPSLMCVKKTDDAGTVSEDDGLPCSPPEYTTLHAVMAQRNSSISLEGTGCDDDQLSCAASSRGVSPLVVPGDFSLPASPFGCLDNSAAKHKLGLRHKACNRRKPVFRLEMKAEGDSVGDETLNTSITEASGEREQHKTSEAVSVDELKPKVDRDEEEEEEDEEEEEQPQHSRHSLVRDEEEGQDKSEAEQDVSPGPGSSSLLELCHPDPQALASSKPSSRASSLDSPRATPEPPAGLREYPLDPPSVAHEAEEKGYENDSALSGEEDEVLDSRGEEEEEEEEESSFLQEVLSSLKTPLASCLETEGVVLETEEEGKEQEREDVEIEGGEEVKDEEAEEDEPVGYQADSDHTTQEVVSTSSTASCQDGEEEEEELVVEHISEHGQEEEGENDEAEEEQHATLTGNTVDRAEEEERKDVEESEGEEEVIELETKEPEVEEEGLEKRDQGDEEVKDAKERVEEAEEAMEDERDDAEEMTGTFPEEKGAVSLPEEEEGVAVGDVMACTNDDETQLGGHPGFAVVRESQTASTESFGDEREDSVDIDHTEQISEQEEKGEANRPDADLTEQALQREGVETSHLDMKQGGGNQGEQAKPFSLFLPESHCEAPSLEGGASTPSKTSTIHINLLSPSSEKATPFFPQSPTAAHRREGETPCHAVAATQRRIAATEEEREEEEPADNVETVEVEKHWALDGEATPPASGEEDVKPPPRGSEQSRTRFTIAPAWQRSLSVGDVEESLIPPSSPSACVSHTPSAVAVPGGVEAEATKGPEGKAEPSSRAKVELVLSSGRVRTTGTGTASSSPSSIQTQTSAAAKTDESSVVVEGNPDNPFGVRLRKTSALHRFSSEEESPEPPIEPPAQPTSCRVDSPQPISVMPSISQPVSNKPALPKKPDGHGDSVGKNKRISDPAAGRGFSTGSDSPSWISVAKQKQKIYKENSLEEITIRKEEPERKRSLPMSVSSAGSREPSNGTAEFTGKVSPLEIKKPSASVEKEARRALSPPTPVPPQPPKSQSLPCPVPPKPQLPPAQANSPQRSVSPPAPIPVPQKSPSSTSPPPPPKTATSSKTPPPQSVTLTSPPFSSRTAAEKSGSRAPGLSSQTPASQRGQPPPASPQDEPPWMALAKKKAKAWSEMPQIVQ
ncbi:cancer-related regulator of actin dynamics isoform X2 [Etheostoma spectabile]|uniref:cancer-related regulator of actin dynamics isoform X2 n=1 Tax=Etheostoma spectabile TaxID=54343 RepID=UPI0013AFE03D|nr:cancer-related regulator of actin dynamics-like isoform X2 [Etheostoma spectabile]